MKKEHDRQWHEFMRELYAHRLIEPDERMATSNVDALAAGRSQQPEEVIITPMAEAMFETRPEPEVESNDSELFPDDLWAEPAIPPATSPEPIREVELERQLFEEGDIFTRVREKQRLQAEAEAEKLRLQAAQAQAELKERQRLQVVRAEAELQERRRLQAEVERLEKQRLQEKIEQSTPMSATPPAVAVSVGPQNVKKPAERGRSPEPWEIRYLGKKSDFYERVIFDGKNISVMTFNMLKRDVEMIYDRDEVLTHLAKNLPRLDRIPDPEFKAAIEDELKRLERAAAKTAQNASAPVSLDEDIPAPEKVYYRPVKTAQKVENIEDEVPEIDL